MLTELLMLFGARPPRTVLKLSALAPLLASTVFAQTASISGAVTDAKTGKPVPAALVMAIRAGAPPLSRNTRSGGDGAFLIQGLTPGKYSLCVQTSDAYLDPCQWNGAPATVNLTTGQPATGIALRLAAASIVSI